MAENENGLRFSTNGCMVLRHRTKRMQVLLEDYVKSSGDDLLSKTSIVSGCAVIKETEDESIALIRNELSIRDSGKVIITGCLPRINRDRIEQEFGTSVRIIEDLRTLPTYFGLNPVQTLAFADISVPDNTADHSHGDPNAPVNDRELRLARAFSLFATFLNDSWIEDFYRYQTKGQHFWREPSLREILVTEGCNYKCSFCAAKFAIGNTRSRDFSLVARDIDRAIQDGIRKVVLQGDEIGNYAHNYSSLMHICDHFVKRNDCNRAQLAFRYVHPSPMIAFGPWLEEVTSSGHLYYICSALQTGNQTISNRMRRPFNIMKAADRLAGLRLRNKGFFAHTQIIVGYPGETEMQFMDSLQLVKDYQFDYVSYTKFDARPGTKASQELDPLPNEVIQERFDLMQREVEGIRQRRLETHARQVVERGMPHIQMRKDESAIDLLIALAARSSVIGVETSG